LPLDKKYFAALKATPFFLGKLFLIKRIEEGSHLSEG